MSLVYSAGGVMPLPKLAWTFDGTTTDYVQGLTGTTTGSVAYNSSGKFGQSLVITNTPGLVASNYVSYTTPYYPSTLTTAVWLKLNTIGVAGQYFAEFTGTSGGISYVILINSNNTVAFRVQAQGGASTISTVATVTSGQWYHIAAVIDGYNQTIYLNGVLAAGPSPCDTLAFQYRNLRLGGSTSNAGRVLVNGELDDLRIFDTALTAAQVQAVFSEQGVPGRGVVSIPTPQGISLSGTPLFTQLSQTATASAVGAFSLRAVNGISTKAVNVAAGGAFPITGFSTSATQSTNQFTQTLTGYPFTGSYVVNCSTFYSASGTEQPWRCFDKNNNGTWWTTSGGSYSASTGSYTAGVDSTTISGSAYSGEWIQIQLPVSITLLSYTIYNSSTFNRAPVDFKIAGSNDGGTTWTLVDTQTAITSWLSSTTSLTFTPSTQTTAYSYYRLCVNKKGTGSVYLSIGELILNGTVPSLAQDFYADQRGNLLTAPIVGQSLANWLMGAVGYVTKWYDQSGKGNDASQATAANQPVISLATTPASVVFTGNGTTSGQYLTTGNIPFSIATTGKFGVQYIIANNVGGVLATIGPGNRKWWLGNGVASGAGEATQGNYPSLVGGGESYAISGTAVTSAKTSVVYNSTASGSNFYYINGSSVSLSTNTKLWNSNQDGTYPLQIGWSSTFSYYSGNLFEFIMTNTSFTTNDIAVVSATS